MSPKCVQITPFKVSGIGIRTANRDEIPTTPYSKIPDLWKAFFCDNIAASIDERIPDTPIYGAYTNYESDQHGYFDLVAGVKVADNAPEPMQTIEIEGGDYLMFPCGNEMPQAIIDGWQEIYAYFDGETPYQRRFSTDFEQYVGDNDVSIYIAVQFK